mmetsp:Transcript_82598/g.155622  ORF Transcript_82598/g.155622 Transcript_82598/m.155622 type:complete len:221 (+) Transcript_82598:63-725(+)
MTGPSGSLALYGITLTPDSTCVGCDATVSRGVAPKCSNCARCPIVCSVTRSREPSSVLLARARRPGAQASNSLRERAQCARSSAEASGTLSAALDLTTFLSSIPPCSSRKALRNSSGSCKSVTMPSVEPSICMRRAAFSRCRVSSSATSCQGGGASRTSIPSIFANPAMSAAALSKKEVGMPAAAGCVGRVLGFVACPHTKRPCATVSRSLLQTSSAGAS